MFICFCNDNKGIEKEKFVREDQFFYIIDKLYYVWDQLSDDEYSAIELETGLTGVINEDLSNGHCSFVEKHIEIDEDLMERLIESLEGLDVEFSDDFMSLLSDFLVVEYNTFIFDDEIEGEDVVLVEYMSGVYLALKPYMGYYSAMAKAQLLIHDKVVMDLEDVFLGNLDDEEAINLIDSSFFSDFLTHDFQIIEKI